MTTFRYGSTPRRTVLRPRTLDRRLEVLRQNVVRISGLDLGQRPAGFEPAQGDRLDWFKVVQEFSNHVLCNWRNTAGTYQIAVLKPPNLTNAINTRTVNGEQQFIVPQYLSASVIYGARLANGSGLTYTSTSGVTRPYLYVDMNVDGRAWAQAVT